MSLTREEFLKARIQTKEVEVEGLGKIYIRKLSMAEEAMLGDLGKEFAEASAKQKLEKIVAPLLTWTIVDDRGNPIFTEKDVPEIIKKPSSVLLPLQDAVLEYSALTKESRESLEKNFETTQDEEANLQ